MKHVISVSGGINLGGSVSVSVWTPYSLDHLYSALYFAEQSQEFEKRYNTDLLSGAIEKTKLIDKYFRKHRACVTGSLFSSIAFLEATINELFAGIVELPNNIDPQYHIHNQLDDRTKDLCSKL